MEASSAAFNICLGYQEKWHESILTLISMN